MKSNQPILYKREDGLAFVIFNYVDASELLSKRTFVEKKLGESKVLLYDGQITSINLFSVFKELLNCETSFINDDSLMFCDANRKYIFVPVNNLDSQPPSNYTYIFDARNLNSDGRNRTIFNVEKLNIFYLGKNEGDDKVTMQIGFNDFLELINYDFDLIIVNNVAEYLSAIYYYRAYDIGQVVYDYFKKTIEDNSIQDGIRDLFRKSIAGFPLLEPTKKSKYSYSDCSLYIGSLTNFIFSVEMINKKTIKNNHLNNCLEELADQISHIRYFYRGVGLPAFKELPAILRKKRVDETFEDDMFYDFALQFPHDINKLSPIEKLTEMQHYGLPTRLLDTTSNPLVALYMSCNRLFNNPVFYNKYGEVIVYPMRSENYVLNSAPILLTASLCILSDEEKAILKDYNNPRNKQRIERIKHNMIGFISQTSVIDNDFDTRLLQKNYFVEVGNINTRITAQSGAFILFGLDEDYINSMESSRKNKKKIIISNKLEIYQELMALNICDSSLFPDKDHAARFIKEKFTGV